MLILILTLLSALANEPLKVGVVEIAPFIVHEPNGQWSGISIDLWKQIAEKNHYEYEIVPYAIKDLRERGPSEVDVALSFNVNPRSAALFDLTHSFQHAGLGIAVRPDAPVNWRKTLSALATYQNLQALGIVGGALGIFSALMWLIERKKNEDEFGGRIGPLNGFFWAMEAFIGYNDPRHTTVAGRAVGITWVCICTVVLSVFTAQIAAEITSEKSSLAIEGPDDLSGVRVATVEKSTAAQYLNSRGIAYEPFSGVNTALDALAQGKADAVVFEHPVLDHQIATNYHDNLTLTPSVFQLHGYAIGLKKGSPLREDVNRALLEIVESPEWEEVQRRYLPATD